MQLATVVGNTIATIKHPSLRGQKLLIVQPRLTDGSPDGEPLLAIDILGAGVGETVMLSSDGKYSREVLKAENCPVRWTVIGIKDA